MKISLTMHDECARAIVNEVADRYCRLCIYSRLPHDTVNAPWRYGDRDAYIAKIDRRRAAYRKTLQSFLPDLPAVPPVVFPNYTSPGDGKVYSTYLGAHHVATACKAYVTLVEAAVFKREAA